MKRNAQLEREAWVWEKKAEEGEKSTGRICWSMCVCACVCLRVCTHSCDSVTTERRLDLRDCCCQSLSPLFYCETTQVFPCLCMCVCVYVVYLPVASTFTHSHTHSESHWDRKISMQRQMLLDNSNCRTIMALRTHSFVWQLKSKWYVIHTATCWFWTWLSTSWARIGQWACHTETNTTSGPLWSFCNWDKVTCHQYSFTADESMLLVTWGCKTSGNRMRAKSNIFMKTVEFVQNVWFLDQEFNYLGSVWKNVRC